MLGVYQPKLNGSSTLALVDDDEAHGAEDADDAKKARTPAEKLAAAFTVARGSLTVKPTVLAVVAATATKLSFLARLAITDQTPAATTAGQLTQALLISNAPCGHLEACSKGAFMLDAKIIRAMEPL